MVGKVKQKLISRMTTTHLALVIITIHGPQKQTDDGIWMTNGSQQEKYQQSRTRTTVLNGSEDSNRHENLNTICIRDRLQLDHHFKFYGDTATPIVLYVLYAHQAQIKPLLSQESAITAILLFSSLPVEYVLVSMRPFRCAPHSKARER